MGALLVGLGWSLAQAPQATAARPIEILSLRLFGTRSGVELEILASAKMKWTAGYNPAGELVLRLPDSVPAPGVSGLDTGAGVVSSVDVTTDDETVPPSTKITIHTHETPAYSVALSGKRLVVSLRPAPSKERPKAPPVDSAADPREPSDTPLEDAEFSSPSDDVFAIGPGDLLQIDFFDLDELDSRVRVLRDGTITLPLLGNFTIAGLTVRKAEQEIADILAERGLATDPQVSIFVEEFVSQSVSVQGAVQRPGVYQLRGNDTLLDVIGQAGGLTGEHGRQIVVLRRAAEGAERRAEIDLARLVEQGDLSLNISLRPGDIVLVPPARQLRVYVTGAVRQPGAFEYSSAEGITVLQAVIAAGGPTERANLRHVRITRLLPDGTKQRIKVNLKRIKRGKDEDLILQENDTVLVGEWFL